MRKQRAVSTSAVTRGWRAGTAFRDVSAGSRGAESPSPSTVDALLARLAGRPLLGVRTGKGDVTLHREASRLLIFRSQSVSVGGWASVRNPWQRNQVRFDQLVSAKYVSASTQMGPSLAFVPCIVKCWRPHSTAAKPSQWWVHGYILASLARPRSEPG
jgi:hypothetical protein